jgi:flagellar protein FlbD
MFRTGCRPQGAGTPYSRVIGNEEEEEKEMIYLHKLSGKEFVLNANHIERIEESPDTTITLTNDRVYLVQESAEEVISRVIDFQNRTIEEKYRKREMLEDAEKDVDNNV